jgi:hypothetical protein
VLFGDFLWGGALLDFIAALSRSEFFRRVRLPAT